MHREQSDSLFGYSNLDKTACIDGFEPWASEGLVGSAGPLKSNFCRVSITVEGTVDIKIGLDDCKDQSRTISPAYPNYIFARNNIRADAFGKYLLFSDAFLNELVPLVSIPATFPFLRSFLNKRL